MARSFAVTFVAGPDGEWRIGRLAAVIGEALPPAARLSIFEDPAIAHRGLWQLRGVASHARYSTTAELALLAARSPPLGRADASCAALIPIRKSEAWWSLGQDERRAIFEDRSAHIARSMKHLLLFGVQF
jgi:hypothetical protein